MNRQRRAHAKSRDGCAQCKERHVKCNEVHPQCQSCRRHNIPCSFSAPSLTATPPLSQDSLADLELLHYWHRHPIPVTSSPGTAANQPGHDPVRLGFSHHYLLNSVLALAALQLFDEDRSQTRWYVRALAHRHAAISRSRPHFFQRPEPEASQHLALLNFSFYTSLYSLAEPLIRPLAASSPGRGHQRPDLDPVNEFLQVIRLGRSSTVFVRQHLGSAVCSDPFLVAKYHPARLEAVHGLEVESRFPQLAWLRGFIGRQCGRGQEGKGAVCLAAADSLFVSIAHLADKPDNIPTQMRAIWGWASNVDEAFLDMCAARDLVALVVFAHFAALMSLGRHNWYFQSWPAVLLGQIRKLLGDELKDAIRWPEDIIFGGGFVLQP